MTVHLNSQLTDVLVVEEGSFCDPVDVGQEREGRVKGDSEVVDLGGEGDNGAIHVE